MKNHKYIFGYKSLLFFVFFFIYQSKNFAQNDSSGVLKIGGYAEVYYSYDFSKPSNHEKPEFIYNHKRHNELNVNLLLLKANYTNDWLSANLGWMKGNYAQYNLAAEPSDLRGIYEANIGFALNKKKTVKLETGVLPSHIGFESAIGADCFTLTRSLVAENSPYFETGIKLSGETENKKWFFAGLILNGWQKMQRTPNEEQPSYGLQIQYKPSNKLTVNYSNFFGQTQPDTSTIYRFYHNLYLISELNTKSSIILSCDVGVDKKTTKKSYTWIVPVCIIKTKLSSNSSISFRTEYFNDPDKVILSLVNGKEARVFGSSINLDKRIHERLLLRFEAKHYYASEKIFIINNQANNNNYTFTSALCFQF
jgi:hypothetical protein